MFQEHAPVHEVTSNATRTTSPAVRFSTSLFVFYSVSGIKPTHQPRAALHVSKWKRIVSECNRNVYVREHVAS